MGKSERDIPRQRNADVQPTESVQVRPRTERRFRRRHRRGAEHPHVGKYVVRANVVRVSGLMFCQLSGAVDSYDIILRVRPAKTFSNEPEVKNGLKIDYDVPSRTLGRPCGFYKVLYDSRVKL